MLKLENAGFFFPVGNFYNMHKTLFSGVYVIWNVRVTICVRCTVISDKNCKSRELKL